MHNCVTIPDICRLSQLWRKKLVMWRNFRFLCIRDQREFSIPGILVRISFIFSRVTMRFHFIFLVPFSKHEILKEKISFSSQTSRFIRKNPVLSRTPRFRKKYSRSRLKPRELEGLKSQSRLEKSKNLGVFF